jgi:HEAT repeat protein
MIALFFCLLMFDEPELIPIPQIVATLKAEKESLAHITRSRRLTITPGTEVLGVMRKHGTKMVPALKELLIDESPLVRKNGVFALGYLNDLVAEREIIPLLEDKDLSVRVLVADNLTMLQDKVVRDALLKALTDEAPEMRKQVIHRLGLYGHENPLRKGISNYDRASMINALGKLVHDPDPDVRDYLCYTLGTYHDSNTIQPLLQLIRDEEPEVRAQAARALSTSGNALYASPALLKAVSDKKDVALAAIYSLGVLKEPLSTKPLIEALGNPELRRQSIIALGMIGDRRATEPLVQYLSDKDPYLRRETALALGKIRDERSVEPLIKAFIAETEQAYLMVPPLGAFNDPRVIQPLVNKMFSDPDNPYIADAVVEVLERIQHPDAIGIPVQAAIAYPGTFAGFAIRRMTGHRFDAEAFERWWHERKGLYEAAK